MVSEHEISDLLYFILYSFQEYRSSLALEEPSIIRQTHRGNMLYFKLYSWRWENSIHSQEETQDMESRLLACRGRSLPTPETIWAQGVFIL